MAKEYLAEQSQPLNEGDHNNSFGIMQFSDLVPANALEDSTRLSDIIGAIQEGYADSFPSTQPVPYTEILSMAQNIEDNPDNNPYIDVLQNWFDAGKESLPESARDLSISDIAKTIADPDYRMDHVYNDVSGAVEFYSTNPDFYERNDVQALIADDPERYMKLDGTEIEPYKVEKEDADPNTFVSYYTMDERSQNVYKMDENGYLNKVNPEYLVEKEGACSIRPDIEAYVKTCKDGNETVLAKDIESENGREFEAFQDAFENGKEWLPVYHDGDFVINYSGDADQIEQSGHDTDSLSGPGVDRYKEDYPEKQETNDVTQDAQEEAVEKEEEVVSADVTEQPVEAVPVEAETKADAIEEATPVDAQAPEPVSTEEKVDAQENNDRQETVVWETESEADEIAFRDEAASEWGVEPGKDERETMFADLDATFGKGSEFESVVAELIGDEKAREFYDKFTDGVEAIHDTDGGRAELREFLSGLCEEYGLPFEVERDKESVDADTTKQDKEPEAKKTNLDLRNEWKQKKEDFVNYKKDSFRAFCNLKEKIYAHKAEKSGEMNYVRASSDTDKADKDDRPVEAIDVFIAGIEFLNSNIVETLIIEVLNAVLGGVSKDAEKDVANDQTNDIANDRKDQVDGQNNNASQDGQVDVKGEEKTGDSVERKPFAVSVDDNPMGGVDVRGIRENGYNADPQNQAAIKNLSKNPNNAGYGTFYGAKMDRDPKTYADIQTWGDSVSKSGVTKEGNHRDLRIPMMRTAQINGNWYLVDTFGEIKHRNILREGGALNVGSYVQTLDYGRSRFGQENIESYANARGISVDEAKAELKVEAMKSFADNVEKVQKLEANVADHKLEVAQSAKDKVDELYNKIEAKEKQLEGIDSDAAKAKAEELREAKMEIGKLKDAADSRMEKTEAYLEKIKDNLEASKDPERSVEDRFQSAADCEKDAVARNEDVEYASQDLEDQVDDLIDFDPDEFKPDVEVSENEEDGVESPEDIAEDVQEAKDVETEEKDQDEDKQPDEVEAVEKEEAVEEEQDKSGADDQKQEDSAKEDDEKHDDSTKEEDREDDSKHEDSQKEDEENKEDSRVDEDQVSHEDSAKEDDDKDDLKAEDTKEEDNADVVDRDEAEESAIEIAENKDAQEEELVNNDIAAQEADEASQDSPDKRLTEDESIMKDGDQVDSGKAQAGEKDTSPAQETEVRENVVPDDSKADSLADIAEGAKGTGHDDAYDTFLDFVKGDATTGELKDSFDGLDSAKDVFQFIYDFFSLDALSGMTSRLAEEVSDAFSSVCECVSSVFGETEVFIAEEIREGAIENNLDPMIEAEDNTSLWDKLVDFVHERFTPVAEEADHVSFEGSNGEIFEAGEDGIMKDGELQVMSSDDAERIMEQVGQDVEAEIKDDFVERAELMDIERNGQPVDNDNDAYIELEQRLDNQDTADKREGEMLGGVEPNNGVEVNPSVQDVDNEGLSGIDISSVAE